jgi:hypothetical protein
MQPVLSSLQNKPALSCKQWGGYFTPQQFATAPSPSPPLKSAKDADARHQSVNELASPSGGAPNPATVLRVFLKRDTKW